MKAQVIDLIYYRIRRVVFDQPKDVALRLSTLNPKPEGEKEDGRIEDVSKESKIYGMKPSVAICDEETKR